MQAIFAFRLSRAWNRLRPADDFAHWNFFHVFSFFAVLSLHLRLHILSYDWLLRFTGQRHFIRQHFLGYQSFSPTSASFHFRCRFFMSHFFARDFSFVSFSFDLLHAISFFCAHYHFRRGASFHCFRDYFPSPFFLHAASFSLRYWLSSYFLLPAVFFLLFTLLAS